MTGEMRAINQDGTDSNGECWGTHAELARRLGGTLKPFDVYQGPYIVIGDDVRVGQSPYALAVQGVGVKRLWLQSEGQGDLQIYREDTDELSRPCMDPSCHRDGTPAQAMAFECLEAAARELLEA